MEQEVIKLLLGLKADIEAMRDDRRPGEDEEFYLTGFAHHYIDDDGECVISWPNLRYHLEKIEALLNA